MKRTPLLCVLSLPLILGGCGASVSGKGGDNTITHTAEVARPTTTQRTIKWGGTPLTEEEMKFFLNPGAKK